MLYIRFSNQSEVLLNALLAQSSSGPSSLFTPVEILVPNTAHKRQIELAAASQFGICANMRFSYLAQWLWAQIGKLTDVRADSPFAPSVLCWRIYTLFADESLLSAHPRLAGYLSRADPVMRMELANKTASLFDQYMTYRADWMEKWLASESVDMPNATSLQREDERWQMDLWQRIMQSLGISEQHPADIFFKNMSRLDDHGLREAGIAERIHVFCLPSIPPLYLDILRRLATRIDVEMYVVNPCQEYWFEIVDRRRLSYLARQEQDQYFEVGNRLLAAWGKQTQSFVDLLLDDKGQATVLDTRFNPAPEDTLLGQLQGAILDMRELEAGSVVVDEGDRSVEIHVCHTLTRELEVLHDQLLALFASDNPPQAAEILVVMPNLEEASPLIDAVFGSVPATRRIPYSITGGPGSMVNPVAKALLDLLSLATSRYQSCAVFGLLQQPLVGRRFGIGNGELDTIRTWLVDAGICWGIDADHRERLELPRHDRHSFRDGLNRLFLGYALPSSIAQPFNTRIAAGNAEGGDTVALGSFFHFFRKIERLHRDLATSMKPDEWRDALLGMLDTFLAVDNDVIEDLRDVQRVIAELARDMHGGALEEAVPANVVTSALHELFDEAPAGGTLSGSVTFAAMSSLRNVPYRVICAVGMSDGVFPSVNRPAEFDLMALSARRGDRQRRSEERTLFLDLLLSARERLYISYTGKSVRDNGILPPSVLVSDLLDYLVPAIASDPRSSDSLRVARAKLVVEHPLQPFSAAYFSHDTDPKLASFNDEYCTALKMRLAEKPCREMAPVSGTTEDDEEDVRKESLPPFFVAKLPGLDKEWHTVSLDQLRQFFSNPCRYLLRNRLGVGMADRVIELMDDEPLLPEFTSRANLADRLLPHFLKGVPQQDIHHLALSGLEYPHGSIGRLTLREEMKMLSRFAAVLTRKTSTNCLPPISQTLEFMIGGEKWKLQGSLGDLRAEGLVRHRYDDTRAIDYLSAWITHLFLNAARCEGAALMTHWISRDGDFHLIPCEDARDCLQRLMELYREGLCEPLPFFPKSSWAYVRDGGNLYKARNAWRSSRYKPYGEDRHEAYQLALRGIDDPLGPKFEQTAQDVYQPMMQFLQDDRLS